MVNLPCSGQFSPISALQGGVGRRRLNEQVDGPVDHHHLDGLHLHAQQVLLPLQHHGPAAGHRQAGLAGRRHGGGAAGHRRDGAGAGGGRHHVGEWRRRALVARAVGAAHAVEAVLVAGVGGQVGVGDGEAGLGAGVGRSEPGVGKDGGEGGAVPGVHPQALPHQVLALSRHPVAEAQLRDADLVVALEGDVAAHHVEEQDAEGPDRRQLAVVTVLSDPLGRGVDSRACKGLAQLPCFNELKCFFKGTMWHQLTVEVGVGGLLEEGAGAEVDELELEGLGVHQQVLILDVPVDDALPVAGQHRLHHLQRSMLETVKLSGHSGFL